MADAVEGVASDESESRLRGAAERGEKVSALCREFGLSRTTGHKWFKRFKELGCEGLEKESRRPKWTRLAAAEDLVMAVLEARDARRGFTSDASSAPAAHGILAPPARKCLTGA